MGDFDFDAFRNARKGLFIFFIIGISLANSLFIFMTVRKPGFLYRPKDLLMISLAIGDIIMALFPLIIFVIHIFHDFRNTFSFECEIDVPARVYYFYLLHFVYGAGLITLAVELLLRYKRQSGAENTNLVKSLAYSAVPWILGLVVVLPLTMAGMDWETCTIKNSSKSRDVAMLTVSVILPAVLSVIVCIVICCIRLVPVQQTHLAHTYPSAAPGVVLATYKPTSEYQQNPDNKTDPPPESQVILPTNNLYPKQNIQHQNMYPPSQQAPTSYPAVDYVTQSDVVISAPVHPIQPPNTAATSFVNPNREKVTLLVSAIVFCVCVVPLTAYILYYTEWFYLIVHEILDWLFVFRSFVTPLIWIVSSKC